MKDVKEQWVNKKKKKGPSFLHWPDNLKKNFVYWKMCIKTIPIFAFAIFFFFNLLSLFIYYFFIYFSSVIYFWALAQYYCNR